jgi:ATP synthase protein I
MDEKKSNPRNEFVDRVSEKQKRKEQARREKHRSIWFGMGMFGLVGWSVAIPTVLFLALGIWIDGRTDWPYSWTLMLLVVGIAVGCLNAWYWVTKESGRGES